MNAVITHLNALPRSQGELIRRVRAQRTQVEFARVLGVERSCLSRYESEALGAPTSVINYCLREFAETAEMKASQNWPIDQALLHARTTVQTLEQIKGRRAPSN